VEGNQLGIGPVAWSPDRYTLAYAVNPGGGVMYGSRPEPALGIWLTRYNHVHPRLLVTFAQLQTPFVINQLSWSPDGRTLAVSTFRRLPGATQPEQPVPVILAVNMATGAVRMLVRVAQDGVFAPRGAALAYTVSGSGPAGGGTLYVADAQGRHGRVLAKGPISSAAWAPDRRTLAYIDGGTAIRTVTVATGQTRLVLTIGAQGLHPPGGQFLRLAWMPARA
jgi:Tol biopolymer transport system component